MAGPILETGRVANRVGKQAIAFGQLGFMMQQRQKLDQRVNAFGFVAVQAGEQACYILPLLA